MSGFQGLLEDRTDEFYDGLREAGYEFGLTDDEVMDAISSWLGSRMADGYKVWLSDQ